MLAIKTNSENFVKTHESFDEIFFPANFFLANTAALCGGGDDGRCYCFVDDFYEGRFTFIDHCETLAGLAKWILY